VSELKTTVPVRLYPTPEQAALLRAHCQEYISTINVLVAALDSDVLLEDTTLAMPVFQAGMVAQIAVRCAPALLDGAVGKPGLLRITRKRGRWIAEIALTLPEPEPTPGEATMGVDLGIKIPAVVHILGKGSRFFGNGRSQRMRRRRFYAGRKTLQQAGKVRAVRKSAGKERRWMRDINHKLSRQIVDHAHEQGVGVIRLEELAGIRPRISQRTACKSGGANRQKAAKARKNNRMKNTWTFFQLTTFITYKAERLGIRVEQVGPAYTSQTCPACFAKNKAEDRRYVCLECGWHGHRDCVGAINIARDTGRCGHSSGATVA
jgi:putative transposase